MMEIYLFKSYYDTSKYRNVRRGKIEFKREILVPLIGDPNVCEFFSKPLYSTQKLVDTNVILTRGLKNKLLISGTQMRIDIRFNQETHRYEYDVHSSKNESKSTTKFICEEKWNFVNVKEQLAKKDTLISRILTSKLEYPCTLLMSRFKITTVDHSFSYFISNYLGLLNTYDMKHAQGLLSAFCNPTTSEGPALEQKIKAMNELITREIENFLYFHRYRLNSKMGDVTRVEEERIRQQWDWFRKYIVDDLMGQAEKDQSNMTPSQRKGFTILKKNMEAINKWTDNHLEIVGSNQQGDILPFLKVFDKYLRGWNPKLDWKIAEEKLPILNNPIGKTLDGFFWKQDQSFHDIFTGILTNVLSNINSKLISYEIKRGKQISALHPNNCVYLREGATCVKIEGKDVYYKQTREHSSSYKKIVEVNIDGQTTFARPEGIYFISGHSSKPTFLQYQMAGKRPKVYWGFTSFYDCSHIPDLLEVFLAVDSSPKIYVYHIEKKKEDMGADNIQEVVSIQHQMIETKELISKQLDKEQKYQVLYTQYSTYHSSPKISIVEKGVFLMNLFSTPTSGLSYNYLIIAKVSESMALEIVDYNLEWEPVKSSSNISLSPSIVHIWKHNKVYSLSIRRSEFNSKAVLNYSLATTRKNKLHYIVNDKSFKRDVTLLLEPCLRSDTSFVYDRINHMLIMYSIVPDQENSKSPISQMTLKTFKIGI